MIVATSSVGDIINQGAFVQAAVNKLNLTYTTSDEKEDLIAEGCLALWQLWQKYDHHRDGYEKAGSFSGYAGRFLPCKLIDAWHRLHPEHQYITTDNGVRQWVYQQPAESLNDDTEHTQNRLIHHDPEPGTTQLEDPITTAINKLDVWDRAGAARLARLAAEGYTDREIADQLGATSKDLQHLRNQLAKALNIKQGAASDRPNRTTTIRCNPSLVAT